MVDWVKRGTAAAKRVKRAAGMPNPYPVFRPTDDMLPPVNPPAGHFSGPKNNPVGPAQALKPARKPPVKPNLGPDQHAGYFNQPAAPQPTQHWSREFMTPSLRKEYEGQKSRYMFGVPGDREGALRNRYALRTMSNKSPIEIDENAKPAKPTPAQLAEREANRSRQTAELIQQEPRPIKKPGAIPTPMTPANTGVAKASPGLPRQPQAQAPYSPGQGMSGAVMALQRPKTAPGQATAARPPVQRPAAANAALAGSQQSQPKQTPPTQYARPQSAAGRITELEPKSLQQLPQDFQTRYNERFAKGLTKSTPEQAVQFFNERYSGNQSATDAVRKRWAGAAGTSPDQPSLAANVQKRNLGQPKETEVPEDFLDRYRQRLASGKTQMNDQQMREYYAKNFASNPQAVTSARQNWGTQQPTQPNANGFFQSSTPMPAGFLPEQGVGGPPQTTAAAGGFFPQFRQQFDDMSAQPSQAQMMQHVRNTASPETRAYMDQNPQEVSQLYNKFRGMTPDQLRQHALQTFPGIEKDPRAQQLLGVGGPPQRAAAAPAPKPSAPMTAGQRPNFNLGPKGPPTPHANIMGSIAKQSADELLNILNATVVGK